MLLGLGLGLGTSSPPATYPVLVSTPLALWLDATYNPSITIVSSKVSVWADRSGNGRDASQSVALQRPTLGTAINSTQTLRFTRTPNALYLSLGDFSAFTAAELFLVLKVDTIATDQGILTFTTVANSGSSYVKTVFADARVFENFMSSTSRDILVGAGVPDRTVARVYNVISTASEYTVNFGTTQVYTSGTNTVACGPTSFIGQAGPDPFNQNTDGDIGEVLIYEDKLSGADRTAVLSYLNAKWGTT